MVEGYSNWPTYIVATDVKINGDNYRYWKERSTILTKVNQLSYELKHYYVSNYHSAGKMRPSHSYILFQCIHSVVWDEIANEILQNNI